MRNRFLILACLFGAVPALAQAPAAPPQAKACIACHQETADGRTPRLNGQTSYYILHRLAAFHDPASQSPHATYQMWDQATGVSAAGAHAIAGYFSQLPVTPAQPKQPLAEQGRALYTTGGAQSCQSCHGAQGEGGGTAPRLAGQRRAYLARQLADFGLMVRYHSGMSAEARSLTPEQATAVAAYLGAD